MARPFPLTVAESSDFTATSRHEDVLRFLRELQKEMKPPARHLSVQSMGKSGLGQEMPLLVLSARDAFTPEQAHASGLPIVLILANIHAGEVEGKESVLMLAREIASGARAALVERATVLVVPNYNCDGNDRIDAKNRALDLVKLEGQIGPVGGVGTRNTAHGWNLNRDYVKLEAPESRNLMALQGRWRPHLTVDCHTTNGSIHGYHLTFDTAHLIPSSPAAPIHFVRDTLLPAVSRNLEAKTKFRTWFYGNFRDQDDPTKGWESYPGLPRFGSHYRGLTGRMDVLLEAYSYVDYKTRCDVMFAILVEILEQANARGAEIVRIVKEAEAETIRRGGDPAPDDFVGINYAELSSHPKGGVLVRHPMHPLFGEVEICAWDLESQRQRKVPGRALARYKTTYYARFVPNKLARRPFAYWIPASHGRIAEHLRLHNIVVRALSKPLDTKVEQFLVDGRTQTSSLDIADTAPPETILFGHHEVEETTLRPGDFVVPMAQPLAHVALYLLEPESDDGLVQWGFFDDVKVGDCFPVRRVPRPIPID